MSTESDLARAVRTRPWFHVLLMAAGLGLGCEEDDSGSTLNIPDPAGTWEHVRGELPLLENNLPAGVILLGEDQGGSVHAQMLGTGGGAWCQDLIYFSTHDSGIVMQIYDDAGNVQHKLLF